MTKNDVNINATLTAAKAIQHIESWTDLPASRKRDLISSLNTIAKVAGVPPELMVLSPERLRAEVLTKSAAAWDVSPSRRTNVLSLLRYSLRRLDVIDGTPIKLSPAWAELRSKLDKRDILSLTTLMRFFMSKDIAPHEVADPVLSEFEARLVSRTLSAGPRDVVTAARRAWNKAVDSVSGWPGAKLSLNSRRGQLLLPLTSFVPSFQEAVKGFKERLAGEDLDAFFGDYAVEPSDDPFASTGNFKPNRPTTITSKLQSLKVAANALHRSGKPLETICSLADLVIPLSNTEATLRQLLKNNSGKPAPYIAHVAELLCQIAKHHVPCSADHVAQIAAWSKKLYIKPPNGMTMRNRKLLAKLWPDHRRLALYHLPSVLMEEANNRGPSYRATVAARRAVIVEILTKFLPRLGVLINLRMADHLIRPDPKKGVITAIMIPEHETKNSRSQIYPVSKETNELLKLWLTKFRPRIAGPNNPYIFPGKNDGPMTQQGVRSSVKTVTGDRVGVALNPHIYRHAGAKTFLQAMPGAMDRVQQLLGHSLQSTSTRMYCDIEDHAATEAFDKILAANRATLGIQKRKRKQSPKPKKAKRKGS